MIVLPRPCKHITVRMSPDWFTGCLPLRVYATGGFTRWHSPSADSGPTLAATLEPIYYLYLCCCRSTLSVNHPLALASLNRLDISTRRRPTLNSGSQRTSLSSTGRGRRIASLPRRWPEAPSLPRRTPRCVIHASPAPPMLHIGLSMQSTRLCVNGVLHVHVCSSFVFNLLR